MLNPINGQIIIKDFSRTAQFNDQLAAKIPGFEVKHEFEGLPIAGTVFAVPADEMVFKVGMQVIFSDDSPRGFKYEGQKLLPIHRDKIMAIYVP